jgi:uncharacterized protein YdhG (YjbR/CyaY superfamily)
MTEPTETFSAEERAAIKERAAETRRAARRRRSPEEEAEEVRAKVAELPEAERRMVERIGAVLAEAVPALAVRLWYGMPAWYLDGKQLCFFQSATKFTTRYSTFGFSDAARLDDGTFWPSAYAITELTPEVERRLADLVARAAG